jgi:eukaryotic-like serine/threonine-protein kinase
MSAPSLPEPEVPEPRSIGRYLLYEEIASGGMASVHLGRLVGPVGFSRMVAIKRMHARFERDPEFVAMFLDEARIAARIHHPNVVQTLDVVDAGGELFLVMEYIEGESLSRLIRGAARAHHAPPPTPVLLSIFSGALQGLHAAHLAKAEDGQPLGVVHRDVSPQNILVGIDGTARVLDFGIAKAMGRLQTTRSGQIKGKLCYMAPEQIQNGPIGPRTDVYGVSVVLWEALTGKHLFDGDEGAIIGQVLANRVRAPSGIVPGLPPHLDAIVLRGLSGDPERRFATALEMARELGRVGVPASTPEVAEWVKSVAASALSERAALRERIESSTLTAPPSRGPAKSEAATETRAPALPSAPVSAPESETHMTWRSSVRSRLTPAASGVGAGLLIAAIVGVALLVVMGKRHATATPPSAAVTGAAPIVEPPPSAPPEPSATPSAPAPQTAASPASSALDAKSEPKRRATVHYHRAAPEKPAESKCNPPYYYDKDGIKMFKPGCV